MLGLPRKVAFGLKSLMRLDGSAPMHLGHEVEWVNYNRIELLPVKGSQE